MIKTNDKIELDKDYFYNTSDSDFKKGIEINKSLTIDGKGHTIDGKNQASIFNITGNNVTIKNVILINGIATEGYGGAIEYSYGSSNCFVINSTFSNNTAEGGGAIYNDESLRSMPYSSSEVTFKSLTVHELEASQVQYSSTPGELEVTYQIGQHMIVPIYITSNKTLSVYEGKPLVIHITSNAIVGDSKESWFNLYDVSAADNPALVDLYALYEMHLLTYDSRYDDVPYEIHFFPLNLSGVSESEFRTYNATPLKVYVVDKTPQDYKLNILGSSKISFKEGEDKVISVIANFNNAVEDSLEDNPMYLYINGEPIKLKNVDASSRRFKINLADYITKSGDYEIFIHPQEKLLKDTFGKNYTYNSVSVHYSDSYCNYFINATKDNGVVNLDKNLDATQTIFITKNNVVINGNGYTINGQNKYQIFKITGNNVTIKNIIIVNATCAIYNNGYNFTVVNSTFVNNSATNGGAIYNDGSKFAVVNSIFINNSATSGGVIYHIGPNFTIVNSTFVNNSADYGGAIYNSGSIHCTVVNSTFVNNSAIERGGAIDSRSNDFTIVNSTFINNSADYGGAIYNNGYNFTVVNSTFINNSADYGGAIYNMGYNNFTVVNSTFINNSAWDCDGGAIYDGYASYEGYYAGFTVVNSTFINNSAGNDGGAIYEGSASFIVVNSTFVNNSADYGGGAIYDGGSDDFIVVNSTFVNNSAYSGGAIRYLGYSINNMIKVISGLRLENNTFVNNKCGDYIYLKSRLDICNGDYFLEINDEDFIDGIVSVIFDGKYVYNHTFYKQNNISNLKLYYNDLNLTNIQLYNVTIKYIKNNDKEHVVKDIVQPIFDIYNPKFMTIGEDEAFYINLPVYVQGNVTVNIPVYSNGTEVYEYFAFAKIVDGFARIPLKNLTNGSHEFQIILSFNNNYTVNYYKYLTVGDNSFGFSPSISSESIVAGDSVLLSLSGVRYQSNIFVYVDGVEYSRLSFNYGKILCSVDDLSVGRHYITLKHFSGQDFSKTYIVNVENKQNSTEPIVYDPNLNVYIPNFDKKSNGIIVITTNNTYSGVVNVIINNRSYSINVVNGGGNETIVGLSEGNYTAVAKLIGNTVFKNSTKSVIFTVTNNNESSLFNPDLNVVIPDFNVNRAGLINVTTNSIYSGIVDVEINDNVYRISVVNGKGVGLISNLPAGNYSAVVKLTGNNLFKDDTKVVRFTVTGNNESVLFDLDLNMSINNYNVDSVGLILVTTNSIYSGIVDVEISNGRVYHINVVNGKGNKSVDDLAEGNYIAVAKFSGNNIFKSTTKTVYFTVMDIDDNDNDDDVEVEDKIDLLLSSVNIKKSAKKLIIKATLKINNKAVKGVRLIFKFKGKTYKAKTNNKGVAKIIIKKSVLKKLKVGKKVKYQVKYQNITKTKSAKVKK